MGFFDSLSKGISGATKEITKGDSTVASQQQPAQPGQQKLDLGTLLKEEFGASLSKVNPDGSAEIVVAGKDGTNSVQRFDTNRYIKDNGLDPMKLKVQYNSPDEAKDENPIGFAEGIRLAAASPAVRLKTLQDKYGAENVQQSEDGTLINDKGVWKKSDPGFVANLISTSPEMVAGIAGSKAGAAIGTAILPGWGTAVGGLIGGAGAAALATVAKNGAEALNLQTQEDGKAALDTFGKELTHNLIWGTVLGTTAKVLSYPGKFASGVLSRAFNTLGDKATLAEAAEKWIPGSSKVDWRTVIRGEGDAKQVLEDMDKQVLWKQQAANTIAAGIDPATKKSTMIVAKSMNGFKQAAMDQYGAAMDALKDAGVAETAQINAAKPAAGFKMALSNLGLIDKSEGKWAFTNKPGDAESGRIMQVFDTKSLSTLKKVLGQLDGVVQDEGLHPLSFNQTRQMMSGIDDILASSGYYNHGEAAISNNARKALMSLRGGLSDALADGLKDSHVMQNGAKVNAADFFKEASGKYSQFREVYDHFALDSQLGGDVKQVSATVDRMLGEKGFGLEDAFGKLASSVGKDAEPVLQRLQQLRAAKNLSDAYSSGSGMMAVGKDIMFGGPRDTARGLAKATITKENLSKSYEQGMMSKLPIDGATKTLVTARAKAVSMLSSMSPDDKMKMLTNPIVLQKFYGAIEGSGQIQQSAYDQMMSAASNIPGLNNQGQ